MSWSVDLFIDSPHTPDVLAVEMSELLRITFKRVPEDGGFCYQSDDLADCHLVLRGDHGMENDRDKNFEDFAYYLAIDARRRSDWEAIRKSCLIFGRFAFEKLKQTGRYKLLLTRQLGTKLDSFSPEPVAR